MWLANLDKYSDTCKQQTFIGGKIWNIEIRLGSFVTGCALKDGRNKIGLIQKNARMDRLYCTC